MEGLTPGQTASSCEAVVKDGQGAGSAGLQEGGRLGTAPGAPSLPLPCASVALAGMEDLACLCPLADAGPGRADRAAYRM